MTHISHESGSQGSERVGELGNIYKKQKQKKQKKKKQHARTTRLGATGSACCDGPCTQNKNANFGKVTRTKKRPWKKQVDTTRLAAQGVPGVAELVDPQAALREEAWQLVAAAARERRVYEDTMQAKLRNMKTFRRLRRDPDPSKTGSEKIDENKKTVFFSSGASTKLRKKTTKNGVLRQPTGVRTNDLGCCVFLGTFLNFSGPRTSTMSSSAKKKCPNMGFTPNSEPWQPLWWPISVFAFCLSTPLSRPPPFGCIIAS